MTAPKPVAKRRPARVNDRIGFKMSVFGSTISLPELLGNDALRASRKKNIPIGSFCQQKYSLRKDFFENPK